ncbi:MAG: FAD/FMN-containing dehydrogenase, partial [Nonlabens sp.]
MNAHEFFSHCLKEEQILEQNALSHRYHHIWHMDEPLKALCVLLPENTEQVSEIMKICFQEAFPVVVHGGLTNLVGGTETTGNEVVISTERLNKIEEIDTSSRTMTVQAGVILEHIHEA